MVLLGPSPLCTLFPAVSVSGPCFIPFNNDPFPPRLLGEAPNIAFPSWMLEDIDSSRAARRRTLWF